MINRLASGQEGIFAGTLAEAQKLLGLVVGEYKRTGFKVMEMENSGGGRKEYEVKDQSGRPVGNYYIDP